MPRTLFDCIGDWFEGIIAREFPDLRKTKPARDSLPDFENEIFRAEAKVGYVEYGAQIKERQVREFRRSSLPVIYFVGFHNLSGLRNLTAGMSEENTDKYLLANAGLHSVYIINGKVIEKMWAAEHHTAQHDSARRYFSIKPRHFDAVINSRDFKRDGIVYNPYDCYKIKKRDLLLRPASMLNGKTKDLRFGVILNKKTDDEVILDLRKRKLID